MRNRGSMITNPLAVFEVQISAPFLFWNQHKKHFVYYSAQFVYNNGDNRDPKQLVVASRATSTKFGPACVLAWPPDPFRLTSNWLLRMRFFKTGLCSQKLKHDPNFGTET